MNKRDYQRLLTLRKSEEELFFFAIDNSPKLPRALIDELPINKKRARYLLKKWIRQGRYKMYGNDLDIGGITGRKLDLRGWISCI